MKTSERNRASTQSDEVRKVLHSVNGKPSHVASAMAKGLEQPSADTAEYIRRLMLQPQEVRKIVSTAGSRLAPEDKDRAKLDAVYACLEICADEERRAIAFGSREAVAMTQRCIYSIKKKFGIN